MIAVRTAPARTPRIGFSNIVRIAANSGTSLRPETASDIVIIPIIKIAKPMRIVPISLRDCFFDTIIRIIPIIARTGENEDGLQSFKIRLSPSRETRLMNHAVTVVPIFEPMMMPTAWESLSIPEFTRPTTMTVVDDDDWITAVTRRPTSTPLMGLFVSFSRTLSKRLPESFSRLEPMTFIPQRNIARPLSIVKKSKKSIIRKHLFFHFLHYIRYAIIKQYIISIFRKNLERKLISPLLFYTFGVSTGFASISISPSSGSI